MERKKRPPFAPTSWFLTPQQKEMIAGFKKAVYEQIDREKKEKEQSKTSQP